VNIFLSDANPNPRNLRNATAQRQKSFLKNLSFPQLAFSDFGLLCAGAAEMKTIFPEHMHGVARKCRKIRLKITPVEKLCTLCEHWHVPCHTFCLLPSRQSERIPR
jgi:hypothetical protein